MNPPDRDDFHAPAAFAGDVPAGRPPLPVPSLPYATRATDAPAAASPGVPNSPVGRLDVAVIAVRVAAVWSGFSAAPALLELSWIFRAGVPFHSLSLVGLAPYGLLLGLGVVLWAAAVPIARRMLADVPPSSAAAGDEFPPVTGPPPMAAATPPATRAPLRPKPSHSVALSVAGAVLAVLALRHLGEAIALAWQRSAAAPDVEASWGLGPDLFRFAVEAAGGAGLFFGARGLSHLWHRARTTDAKGGDGLTPPPGRVTPPPTR